MASMLLQRSIQPSSSPKVRYLLGMRSRGCVMRSRIAFNRLSRNCRTSRRHETASWSSDGYAPPRPFSDDLRPRLSPGRLELARAGLPGVRGGGAERTHDERRETMSKASESCHAHGNCELCDQIERE